MTIYFKHELHVFKEISPLCISVNTRFTDFGDTTISHERYTDIRDDRVNFYFDLNRKGKYDTKTFNVMQNAPYIGTY